MKLSLVAASLALGACLACTACSSRGASPDVGPASVAFTPDPPAGGAAVFLRGHGDAARLYVDVIARGAADVHGAALRLTWDPDALGFVEATTSDAWSRSRVAVAKEGTPGQLAVAWAEKGATGFAANEETVLGTLTFEVRSGASGAVAFRPERSALVDRKGTPLVVAWRGGSVAPR